MTTPAAPLNDRPHARLKEATAPSLGHGPVSRPALAAALDYAAGGWPVFPCRPRGKAPLTVHGFTEATRDPARIRAWWTRWPDANVAIPTGLPETFDVLDVDRRPIGSGWPAFNRTQHAGLLEGWFRVVRTPSRGAHLYYQTSGASGGSIHSEHLDYKAAGGYVLVPPSFVVTDDYSGSYVEVERRKVAGRPLDWGAVRRSSPRRPLDR